MITATTPLGGNRRVPPDRNWAWSTGVGTSVKRGPVLRGAGPQETISPMLHLGASPAMIAARALNYGAAAPGAP
jgi:hypothetical protein